MTDNFPTAALPDVIFIKLKINHILYFHIIIIKNDFYNKMIYKFDYGYNYCIQEYNTETNILYYKIIKIKITLVCMIL